MNSCPKCGSNVRAGAEYCAVCGNHLVPYNINNQPFNNNYMYQNNNFINDDVLVDAYIGKNAGKLKSKNYNICAALFGIWYTMYRKMWLFTLVYVLSAIGVGVIATLFGFSSLIGNVLNIILGSIFNKYYLSHAKEKVNKIKSDNIGKNQQELIEICRKKGGTTIVPIVIGIIISVVMLVVATFAIMEVTKKTQEKAQELQEKRNSQKQEEHNIIDNYYHQNEIDITETINNLTFTVPSGMNIYLNGTNSKGYKNKSLNCMFVVETTSVPEQYNYDANTYLEIDKQDYYTPLLVNIED